MLSWHREWLCMELEISFEKQADSEINVFEDTCEDFFKKEILI